MNAQPPYAVAHLRFVRTAPRKLRRVADAIRGKRVAEALAVLQFTPVHAAEPIEKLVRSAVANASNNHDMNGDELYVARITVDGGPGGRFTKRLDPRAQGRAAFKRKRLSHVTVMLAETPPAKPPKRPAGASVQAAQQPRRAAAAAASTSPKKSRRSRKQRQAAAKEA
ncbi:MAG: 50S ribosomal protein L22 [Candidatus Eremiobacteraeota bacterium]|nr:50S ribosomal protein L22 [Candidatus Eremiobacteraeota bacterium]